MAVVSYFIGCFNFALVISRFKHKDVRKMGSGNPGTMNMSRQFGLKIGAITLFCDMFKAGRLFPARMRRRTSVSPRMNAAAAKRVQRSSARGENRKRRIKRE